MLKSDAQSRLYCAHYVPSTIECSDCRASEQDYLNRPLYAPLYVPLSNLSTVLDNSQLKLPSAFYVPINEKGKDLVPGYSLSNDCVEIQTKNGLVRLPQSILVHQSHWKANETTRTSPCNSLPAHPGDIHNHTHSFTRSFSWKTKPEESPYAQMQPLPKLIKRPDYIEICCKNICWPTHQFCLCCGRNTAESCRKWSESAGEYDCIDACWSSCALCSDDAYKILNTPVVYNEKIIDPEVLLPLDAELLYYSIQSAKRQQEKQQKSSSQLIVFQPPPIAEKQEEKPLPSFPVMEKELNKVPLILSNQDSNIPFEIPNLLSEEQEQVVEPSSPPEKELLEVKPSKSVKTRRSSQSRKKKPNKKKPAKKSNRSRTPSKKSSSRSRHRSKKKSTRSRSDSKRKSKSKTKV